MSLTTSDHILEQSASETGRNPPVNRFHRLGHPGCLVSDGRARRVHRRDGPWSMDEPGAYDDVGECTYHVKRTTYAINLTGTRRTRSRPRRRLDYRQGGVRMRHEHILGLCRRLPAAGSRHRRERPFEVIAGFRLRISLRGRAPAGVSGRGQAASVHGHGGGHGGGVQTVTVETSHRRSGSVSDLSSPLVCRCQTEDVQSRHPTARDATRPPAGLVAT